MTVVAVASTPLRAKACAQIDVTVLSGPQRITESAWISQWSRWGTSTVRRWCAGLRARVRPINTKGD